MSQGTLKNKPHSSTSLQNITNKPIRQSKRNCVVKMQKIDLQKQNAGTDQSTTKTLKRKTKTSDENVSHKKPLLQEANKPSNPSPPVQERCVDNVIKHYEQLQKVISKKYVTVVERLKLDYVPLCCENLEYCHRKHYKTAPPPKPPNINQLNLIRNSLQQARYNVFMSLVWGLCHKEQFPGDVVLTNIVKLILTLNPESEHNAYLQGILDELICLFDIILKTFPPCWLALRESYIKFLRNTMEMSILLPDKTLHAENTIFEIVLILLEDNLSEDENFKNNRSTKRKRGPGNTSSSFSKFENEYHNMQHWEKNDNDEQSFLALSEATRLERLMQVLHFLAKMLEMDMAMWMLRYHKNPSKNIYNNADKPLVIELFSLSEYTHTSVLVKKVMSLYALCVEKNLTKNYLSVMDRFISLLANIQNLCEIQNTSGGIRYPFVGPRTSAFTVEFYKIADVHMKTNVNSYMRLINNLSCPFVRYEYIDIFLKRLNPAAGKMNPQKIVENFRKNRWLECALDEERSLDESMLRHKSIIYRQDYLQFILEALRSYCDYYAIKDFFEEVIFSPTKSVIIPNKNQPQKEPTTAACKDPIDLSRMKKNISKLEKEVDMSVKLRVGRLEIPTVNISVNAELLSQYRTDLKCVNNLHSYFSALQLEHDEDFSKIIEYLKDFTPHQ